MSASTMAEQSVIVRDNKKVGARYCIITADRPEGFLFSSGQFAMLRLEDATLKRAFSIASSPAQPHLEFYVKKVEDGKVSTGLFELKKGDTLFLSGPFGKFVLRPDMERILLVGAGSGIAPLMSMARYLLSIKPVPEVVLFHGVGYADELGYRHELEQAAKAHPSFSVHFCVSREKHEHCLHGRVHEHLAAHVPHVGPGQTVAYVCGPPGMVDSAVGILKTAGLPAESIRTEKYD